jgi:hypothetical protein
MVNGKVSVRNAGPGCVNISDKKVSVRNAGLGCVNTDDQKASVRNVKLEKRTEVNTFMGEKE